MMTELQFYHRMYVTMMAIVLGAGILLGLLR